MLIDKNGVPIKVGQPAIYLGTRPDRERKKYIGRSVWVRAVGSGREHIVRVDDGDRHDTDIKTSESWRWSAWVYPDELAIITPDAREGD